MKMKTAVLLGGICALSVLVSGCTKIQSWVRAKPAAVSPFLEHPELLTKQKATFPFHYFYLKKNAGKYDSIYVAPVNTKYLRDNKNWAKLDQKMAKSLGSDINNLAVFTRQTFRSEFAKVKGPKRLNVVEKITDPKHTLIVELAIVGIVPTKAELVILGTAANILLPGIGAVAGQLATGSVTMECMVRNAGTREIIAMFANTEKGQQAILNIAGMTWYNSAKNNITKQAEHTAKVFAGKDYSYTYRRLIKIIEI